MEGLTRCKPLLKLPLGQICTRVVGNENDREVGIDNDGHLQRRPLFEGVPPFPNKRHSVNRAALRQALAHAPESLKSFMTNAVEIGAHAGVASGKSRAHERLGKPNRRYGGPPCL